MEKLVNEVGMTSIVARSLLIKFGWRIKEASAKADRVEKILNFNYN